MKKVVIFLVMSLLAIVIVSIASANAKSRSDLFAQTLVPGEFSSIETDTTLDGQVLRVVQTKTPEDIPCGSPNGECAARCENAYDDDGDGLIDYPRDPGCDSYSDENEWNPAPPPPPPPPPPPIDWNLYIPTPDYYSQWITYNECEGGEAITKEAPCLSPLAIRCKRVLFSHMFKSQLFGIGLGRAVEYSGGWKICYRPYRGGITSVVYRYGDADRTFNGWSWLGNSSGYPQHFRDPHHVLIRYRGEMQYCILEHGCGPNRHIWIEFDFWDEGLYGEIVRIEGGG